MINIVNKRTHIETPYDIPIHRGFILGNPFTHIQDKPTLAKYICQSREEAILNYEKYLNEKIAEKDNDICNELNRIYKLALKGDVNLLCYCFPKPCHGNIIRNIIESRIILNAVKDRKLNQINGIRIINILQN